MLADALTDRRDYALPTDQRADTHGECDRHLGPEGNELNSKVSARPSARTRSRMLVVEKDAGNMLDIISSSRESSSRTGCPGRLRLIAGEIGRGN
jgi:hypothetical protein